MRVPGSICSMLTNKFGRTIGGFKVFVDLLYQAM